MFLDEKFTSYSVEDGSNITHIVEDFAGRVLRHRDCLKVEVGVQFLSGLKIVDKEPVSVEQLSYERAEHLGKALQSRLTTLLPQGERIFPMEEMN